jgi:hypothetical protein
MSSRQEPPLELDSTASQTSAAPSSTVLSNAFSRLIQNTGQPGIQRDRCNRPLLQIIIIIHVSRRQRICQRGTRRMSTGSLYMMIGQFLLQGFHPTTLLPDRLRSQGLSGFGTLDIRWLIPKKTTRIHTRLASFVGLSTLILIRTYLITRP